MESEKIVAVKVTNEFEFNIVIKAMIQRGWNSVKPVDPLHLWKFETYLINGRDQFIEFQDNPGRFDNNFHFMDRYEIVSFNTLCMIAGIKVPEKPKEVVIEWPGTAADVTVTVRKSHINFEFSKTIVGFCLNTTQQSELSTALKSLEDGQ